MSKANALKGLLLATAAAGLFGGGAFAAADDMAPGAGKVRCEGVNSCKGKGDCMGENGCKGKNACKGQGFLNMSQEECDAAQAKMKAEGAE
ncbi:MAG: hypothetical protein AB1469_03480 [Pseudomonadota bacterium]